MAITNIAAVWALMASIITGGTTGSESSSRIQTVRIDGPNARVFAVGSAERIRNRTELCKDLKEILGRVKTGEDKATRWSVSVFAAPDLARQKDDIPADRVREWASAYLGELDPDGIFWTYPADPSRKKRYDLRSCLSPR